MTIAEGPVEGGEEEEEEGEEEEDRLSQLPESIRETLLSLLHDKSVKCGSVLMIEKKRNFAFCPIL